MLSNYAPFCTYVVRCVASSVEEKVTGALTFSMFTGIVSAHLRTAKILAFILCQFCSRRYAICLKHVAYSCAISMRFHKQYRLVSGSRTWVSQLMLWLSPKKWFWKHWSCGNRRVWHHTVEFWQRHPTQVAASTTDSYCSKLAVGSTQGQAKCGLLTVCWLGKKKGLHGKTRNANESSTILYGGVLQSMCLLVLSAENVQAECFAYF